MPIQSIDNSSGGVVQRCAACEADNVLVIADMELVPGAAPEMLRLPICPRCGAQEFLLRTPDTVDDPEAPDSHRALVRHLMSMQEDGSLRSRGDTTDDQPSPSASGDSGALE